MMGVLQREHVSGADVQMRPNTHQWKHQRMKNMMENVRDVNINLPSRPANAYNLIDVNLVSYR